MKIVNNSFWRFDPEDRTEPASVTKSMDLKVPGELLAKLRLLDGIVIATWEPDLEHGRVHALGIVQEFIEGGSVLVDWRRANFTLRPSGQGAVQWQKRRFFEFVDVVAARYRLMDHFLDAFTTTNGGGARNSGG